MQTRSQLDIVHKKEESHFKQTCDEALEKMKEEHDKVYMYVITDIDTVVIITALCF